MSGYHAQQFSISSEDFERQSVLKRRRQLSPPRSPSAHRKSSSADGSIGFRRTRSKSKSRAREATLKRLPSVQGQEFIALGRSDRTRSTTAASSRGRSPSRGRAAHVEPEPLPLARRTRSSSRARPVEMQAEAKSSHRERGRSKSKSRKRSSHTRRSSSRSRSSSPSPSRHRKSHTNSSSRSSPKRHRHTESKSVSRSVSRKDEKERLAASSSSSSSASAPAIDKKLQDDIDYNEAKLKQAKRDLVDLEEELKELQRRVDKKNYEISDVTIVLDGLHKRRELQQRFLRSDSFTSSSRSNGTTVATAVATTTRRDPSPERELSSRSSRPTKRPCIVDEDDDDEDTESDVEIIERPSTPIKEEVRSSSSRPKSSSSSSRRSAAERDADLSRDSAKAKKTPVSETPTPKEVEPAKDYFWGRVEIVKLLVQPRIRNIPDGSARKGRHLEFNPVQLDKFATSSDDGGMIIWDYSHQKQQISKVCSFDARSFRKDTQCAESIAWSPDGGRIAIGFRDPIESMGEFAVVQLHDVELGNTTSSLILPRKHVKSKSTTLHPRGISALAWVPGGYGDRQGSRGIVTTGPDHNVVFWEEHKAQTDYKWRILHHEHRSDVRTICVHSQGNAIYTGGLDGLVIRYDMHTQRTHTQLERRSPHISKINAVLEHPHNHNLLLVSSVEQSEQNLLLLDLRERQTEKPAMTLSWLRTSDSKSMSQYIVPRWSQGGFHVSCGSTSGLVNIWDIRARGPKFPVVLPHQSIQVHQKQVLHAAWDPRYDALFSVSNDRTIGMLTFR